jgi:hypothetical protein
MVAEDCCCAAALSEVAADHVAAARTVATAGVHEPATHRLISAIDPTVDDFRAGWCIGERHDARAIAHVVGAVGERHFRGRVRRVHVNGTINSNNSLRASLPATSHSEDG